MAAIVFDIETIGESFDSLDAKAQESFLKYAKTEEEQKFVKESLGLYPLTGEIVAIGMLEVETEKGCVYFQNKGGAKEKFDEGESTFISGSEKELLTLFWKQLDRYSQFVTFNGRMFDCPYLMVRSAIHKIPTKKNLVPYRYSHDNHIDLADQLSFYDAMRKKFSLHMWCRAFNITSPKEEGISGENVKDLYEDGHFHDIAWYCMRDVKSTKELYTYWRKYLKF